jgi:hypothetical protein
MTLRLAIAIGFAGPLTVAITGAAYAAPAPSSAIGLKAAAPFVATNLNHRKRALGYQAYRQGYDPLRGTYWDNVAPYIGAHEPDPLRGTYFDNVAPY